MLPFEGFVEQSQRAETVAELESLFVRVMAEEGFENYFLGSITQHNVLSATWLAFPESHFETYLAEHWYEVDPILSLTARATRPFCWDDAAATLMFSQRQVAMLDECKRAGVHAIIVTPFQSQDGRSDIVGISRRHAGRPDVRRIPVLQAICAQTWCRYADLIGGSLTGETEAIALTSRELEILRWIKHGKNNTEISEITSVAVKTIEYHVGNIFKKLGAGNRTAAVVIANQEQTVGALRNRDAELVVLYCSIRIPPPRPNRSVCRLGFSPVCMAAAATPLCPCGNLYSCSDGDAITLERPVWRASKPSKDL